MSIQFAFFSVPMGNPSDVGEDLNRLLKSERVLAVHREFVSDGGNSVWAFAVEYLSGTMDQKKGRPGKGRVDYREVLSPEDFALFVKLRDWRKETAGREAIPVYTVFTNEQLANLAKLRPGTMTGLRKIDGIGEARLKKYGEDVLGITSEMNDQKGGEAKPE